MVSPLDLLEFREEAERARKELAERSIALEDIKTLGDARVNYSSLFFIIRVPFCYARCLICSP